MNDSVSPTRPVRSPGAIVTDSILLAFAGAIVLAAFRLTSEEARLVPLLFGVPTVVALGLQLLFDLFPTPGRRFLRVSAGVRSGSADGPAGLEVNVDAEALSGARAARRMFAFAGWVIGFAFLAYLTSFLVSVPVALIFFYRYMAGQTWRRSILIATSASVFVYVVFGLVLNVPF